MRVIVLRDDGTFSKAATFAIHYDGWTFVYAKRLKFEYIFEKPE